MDSYTLLSVIIIAFWLAGFFVYIVLSNRQRDIETEIEQVNAMLESGEADQKLD